MENPAKIDRLFKMQVADMSLQICEGLEFLHKVGFCHWDIKLDNICYLDGKYCLIDFAFAQQVYPFKKKKIQTLKGNSMFASLRKFQFHEVAEPIDDIESLLYLTAFCLSGFNLPWLDAYLTISDTLKFLKYRLDKANQHADILCSRMPAPLSKALQYVNSFSLKTKKKDEQVPPFNIGFVKTCLK